METTYILKIYYDDIKAISKLLKKKSSSNINLDYWSYEIIESSNDSTKFFKIVNYFSKKKEILDSQLKGYRVSLWILNQYEDQCNMEFPLSELQLLTDLKINLCISCWEI